MNILITRSILILAFIITFSNCILAEDTIYIPNNSVIINNALMYKNYSEVELIKPETNEFREYIPVFGGYLVVQIDSNTKTEKAYPGWYFYTTVYWIKSLEDICIDSLKYYYDIHIGLMVDGREKFINGKRDGLSSFLYCYNLFNDENSSGTHTENTGETTPWNYTTSYLFEKRDWLKTDNLFKKSLWMNDNKNITYIIFGACFSAEFLYFKNLKKKSLIPTSYTDSYSIYPLEESNNYSEEEMNKLGFKKSNKEIKFY